LNGSKSGDFEQQGSKSGDFAQRGEIGTYNMLKRKSQDSTLPYSSWQQEMQKGIEWFGDHFVVEGTAAVKYGSYFSILLKNGFGATLGGYMKKG